MGMSIIITKIEIIKQGLYTFVFTSKPRFMMPMFGLDTVVPGELKWEVMSPFGAYRCRCYRFGYPWTAESNKTGS